MRKIEAEAREAWTARKEFKKANTEIVNDYEKGTTTLLLHGNAIARKRGATHVCCVEINLAAAVSPNGEDSVTTRSRLNSIVFSGEGDAGVWRKKGITYLALAAGGPPGARAAGAIEMPLNEWVCIRGNKNTPQ